MLRDVEHGVAPLQTLDPIIVTADKNGVGIDLQGFESALIVADVGISGDTLSASVKAELELEDSPDNSVWTDVTDINLTRFVAGTNPGTFALIDDPAEDQRTYITAYIGDKRFVRVVIELTGTHTNGIEIGATVLRGVGGLAHVGNPSP